MALILCPRCQHLLGQGDPSRYPCSNCHGLYMRRESIDDLIEELKRATAKMIAISPYREAPGARSRQVAPSAPAMVDEGYLRCPFCSKHMNRARVVVGFDVRVDYCLTHGLWFDAKELDAIKNHLAFLTQGLEGEEKLSAILKELEVTLGTLFPVKG